MPCLLPWGSSVQAKGARLVAVSSVKGCRLSAMCDMAVHLPLERELCPFDLAPVTSTAAQMLFGDTVAIALMQVSNCNLPYTTQGMSWLAHHLFFPKGKYECAASRSTSLRRHTQSKQRKSCCCQAKRLTQEDFAMNHPAGRIGKRLILRVHDVMLTGSSLPLIGPDVLIMEVTSLPLSICHPDEFFSVCV